MKTLSKRTWKIPSNYNNICCIIRDIIDYLSQKYGPLDEGNLFEIKVILNELALNAIKHGNKEDPSKQVIITAGLTENKYVYFIIEDEGKGYECKHIINNLSKQDEIADLCSMKETGRGILIVKSLSDRICFSKKGNKVIVLKKLIKR